MKDTVAIILAAGRGTRMKSETPKVLHNILGKPMISHLLNSARQAGIRDYIAVTGYGSHLLKGPLGSAKILVQNKLLGSGDAVMTAKKTLAKYSGDCLVLYGDTPLIGSGTIKNLIAKHKSSGAAATILTTRLKDPRGYGRIIRDSSKRIVKIVEEEKAAFYEEVIEEVNVGTYCFKAKDLFASLLEIIPDNVKKEYYLTDVIEVLHKNGKKIESASPMINSEMIGVNSRKDLAEASRILKTAILEQHMANGVTIEDPASITIYPDVKIGKETVIRPNTMIESDVEIGDACEIGPFSRIRSGVKLGDRVEIGNYVELVRTKVGDKTKIKHHSYMGDARIGKNVNIGAGAITANYDGLNKNRTIIEDGVFIGVGAILIAPVKVGKKAIVGAGCVVPKNHNVPRGATVVGVPSRILKMRGRKHEK